MCFAYVNWCPRHDRLPTGHTRPRRGCLVKCRSSLRCQQTRPSFERGSMSRRKRTLSSAEQPDLFATASEPHLDLRLAHEQWPPSTEFPVNHGAGHVRDQVWSDLTSSQDAVVVAGFASIAKIIELAAAAQCKSDPGRLRVLLGTEPFATERRRLGSRSAAFTNEVTVLIDEQGISLLLSAKMSRPSRPWTRVGEFRSCLGGTGSTPRSVRRGRRSNRRLERCHSGGVVISVRG